jgi:hypothetical protein
LVPLGALDADGWYELWSIGGDGASHIASTRTPPNTTNTHTHTHAHTHTHIPAHSHSYTHTSSHTNAMLNAQDDPVPLTSIVVRCWCDGKRGREVVASQNGAALEWDASVPDHDRWLIEQREFREGVCVRCISLSPSLSLSLSLLSLSPTSTTHMAAMCPLCNHTYTERELPSIQKNRKQLKLCVAQTRPLTRMSKTPCCSNPSTDKEAAETLLLKPVH